MRSFMVKFLAAVVACVGAGSAMAADSSVVTANLPSAAPAAVAATQTIIPAGGCCGKTAAPSCDACTAKPAGCDSCAAKADCGSSCGNSCGLLGLRCRLGGCLAGISQGHCLTPIGAGNAGTHGICIYGAYNLR